MGTDLRPSIKETAVVDTILNVTFFIASARAASYQGAMFLLAVKPHHRAIIKHATITLATIAYVLRQRCD
jgi:hypothetical protein